MASSGAWNDWSHWPGRICRLSTSSAATRRIVTARSSSSSAALAVRLGRGFVFVLGRLLVLVRASSLLAVGRRLAEAREGLGQGVGQVAEDVGGIVELDDVVGAVELAPACPVSASSSGTTSAANEPVALEREPLVLVVDDDQVAQDGREPRTRPSRTARADAPRSAGCAPGRRGPGRTGARPLPPRVSGASRPRGRRPSRRRRRRTGSRRRATVSSARCRPSSSRSSVAVGSSCSARLDLAGLGERRRRRRPGCTARRARTGSRSTSVSVTHLPVFVEVAAAAAERQVGGDGEVVHLVVDQHQAAELARSCRVRRRGSSRSWPRRPCEEIGPLQRRPRRRARRACRCGSCPSLAPCLAVLPLPLTDFVSFEPGPGSQIRPIRSRRNIEWCRSKIHSPAAMAEGAGGLVRLELVDRGVVGQVEQDHVVEVPAVGDVVPAEEPDPVLALVVASSGAGMIVFMKNLKNGSRPRRTGRTWQGLALAVRTPRSGRSSPLGGGPRARVLFSHGLPDSVEHASSRSRPAETAECGAMLLGPAGLALEILVGEAAAGDRQQDAAGQLAAEQRRVLALRAQRLRR